ncbi:MAG TPA: Na/Pi symporter [Chitinophagaceae bacterium]|nr:Na/Pi symporter [Chitinophagaceae bacterium]
MLSSFEIWKLLAGIAIFLMGVGLIEESLQKLTDRRFKLFLRKQTANKLKAIGGGAIVTGVLQSSSVVSLMVLAFVGAGIITMQNALAVILGANLGTTISSWLVVLVGFKLNIDILALPVIGVAGIGYAIFNKQSRWHQWSMLLLGLSFLFFGLGFMKTGIEGLVKVANLQDYQDAPVIIFFLVGLAVTSVIQSSSAMVAITLSALHAGGITLLNATAVVLGAEVGTTLKLFMASFKGIAAKRRVALGNFIFNCINVTVILLLLSPVNKLITDVLSIKDHLVALVIFQTLVNIFGIILFYPLLSLLGKFLESRFRNTDDETMFIHNVPTSEPSAAIIAMEKEDRHFLFTVHDFIMSCFGIPSGNVKETGLRKSFLSKPVDEKYEYIKYLHGEIHSYYINVQQNATDKEDIEKLDRFISSVRNGMYAAKSFKDAIPDLDQLHKSSNDVKYEFYKQSKQVVTEFCDNIFRLLNKPEAPNADEIISIFRTVTGGYNSSLQHFYKGSTAKHVSEKEISTLLNFNRELVTGFKSLVFAVKDYRLDRKQSKILDELPGFIR